MARTHLKALQDFIRMAAQDLNASLTRTKVSLAVLAKSPSPDVRQRHLRILEAQTVCLQKLWSELCNVVALERIADAADVIDGHGNCATDVDQEHVLARSIRPCGVAWVVEHLAVLASGNGANERHSIGGE
jgi:hypothetical protein